MEDGYDVVIVGAGVIGCAIADTVASERDVLVLDRAGVGMGATGRAAGLVTPTLFYGDRPAAARHANAFFRSIDGATGFEFTERRRYDLVTGGEAAAARERARRRADDGFPVTFLDAAAVEREAPRLLVGDFAGAVRYDDAGWVDPYALATALQRRAVDRGATFVTHETVESVDEGRVEGTFGRVEADEVVVAAGWRTPDLLATDLPIRAYRTQVVVLEPTDPLDDAFPMGRVGSEHLYFRPEHDGTLVVGGGHELLADPDGASERADESYVESVATTVPDLVRGFEDAGLVNGWAGVDSASPDARPVIDRVDGMLVATGFNGLGILAAPIAAAVVGDRLGVCGAHGIDPTPYAADRFDPEEPFAFRSTSDLGR
ncbi:MAG: NAD(P)/FAD-dependent oxidoreductase [Halanaeroarchaeum sp.]